MSAPDGYANLRQAPNAKAAITQRLPRKQTAVLELKQNGAWKLVQVLEQTGNPVTGFVPQKPSQLDGRRVMTKQVYACITFV